MKKVVFIINSIQQQRCIKRIEEFIDNGYEVVAYGFNRDSIIPTLPTRFKIEIIASFSNQTSYLRRFFIMLNALRAVIKKHRNEDIIYYYFLLDVAIVCRLLTHKTFIYEESDLMQTYMPSRLLCKLFNTIDRLIIKHSLLTTMTSEGFLQYHYAGKCPHNVIIVPNKLNKNILNYPILPTDTDINHLRIAFVGAARFKSIVNFADVLLKNFPQHEMHFYGYPIDCKPDFERIERSYFNVFFHGKFSNPQDLPKIYSNIDLVLATYDTKYPNVRYAEPNKLYEAIYFNKPIVVSEGTFLAQRVSEMGIGFAINPLNDCSIISFINNLTIAKLNYCKQQCNHIKREDTINNNHQLFDYLEKHNI